MTLRDDIETTIRVWDAHEVKRGASAVIDYDCNPQNTHIEPAASRLAVYREVDKLRRRAKAADETTLAQRLDADRAYLAALMGERLPLADYVLATQGCDVAGWANEYISERGEIARKRFDALGIEWGPRLIADFTRLAGPIDTADVSDAIRQAANEYEPAVRMATGATANYDLTIEVTNLDAYWEYWLDGAGQYVRLRLNMRNADFTLVSSRQFALHEILGHGLQDASFAARCASENVPWVRLMSVHAQQQILLEGLAQAMPLFITPDDELLIARVRLDHYTQLIRAEMHIAINAGTSIEECAAYGLEHVPWWTDTEISDILTDRSANPQLRSYLWAYPAGFDWFANLADADKQTVSDVLHAAYRDPLTPADLAALWPTGPTIGGTNGARHNPA